jgi:hypothetical protein
MKRISDVSPTSLYVAEVPIVAMCGAAKVRLFDHLVGVQQE